MRLLPRPCSALPGFSPVVHGQDAAVQIGEGEDPGTFVATDIKELWGRDRGGGLPGNPNPCPRPGVGGGRSSLVMVSLTSHHSAVLPGDSSPAYGWLRDKSLQVQVHGSQWPGAGLGSSGDSPIFWSVDATATRFMLCRHTMSMTHICWLWNGWIW